MIGIVCKLKYYIRIIYYENIGEEHIATRKQS